MQVFSLASMLLVLGSVLSDETLARLEGTAMCTPGEPTENVVVFLTGSPVPPFKVTRVPFVLDQRNLRFHPHVLPILRGSAVAFPNSDPIHHNVFSASAPRMFNLGTYPAGVSRSVTFDRPGVVEVLCNVHPEMSAYILILETPCFSTTDPKGFFHFPNLPPGVYQLHFWCEHHGFLSAEITLDPGQRSLIQATLHQCRVIQDGNELQCEGEKLSPDNPFIRK